MFTRSGSLILENIFNDLFSIHCKTNGAAKMDIRYSGKLSIETMKLGCQRSYDSKLVFFILTFRLLVLINNIGEKFIGNAILMIEISLFEFKQFSFIILNESK